MRCTLESDINSCPHFQKENSLCKYKEKCSYQFVPIEKEPYVRKERWYEKFYKK